MTIRNLSEERLVSLLREWNDKQMSEPERRLRSECDRFMEVEVTNQSELDQLGLLDKYLTGGHGFYVYLRYPEGVDAAVQKGLSKLPRFFYRAEHVYKSLSRGGSVRVIIGLIQERLDPAYELGLFIDILEKDRQEKAARREEERSQPELNTAVDQPQQSASRPQQPAYQPAPQQQSYWQAPGTNVVHYNFSQVS